VGSLLPVVLVILEIDEYLSRIIERADYSIMGTVTIEVSDRVVLDVVTFARLLRQTDVMFGPSCAATTKFFRSALLLRSYALVLLCPYALVPLPSCALVPLCSYAPFPIVETTYFWLVRRFSADFLRFRARPYDNYLWAQLFRRGSGRLSPGDMRGCAF